MIGGIDRHPIWATEPVNRTSPWPARGPRRLYYDLPPITLATARGGAMLKAVDFVALLAHAPVLPFGESFDRASQFEGRATRWRGIVRTRLLRREIRIGGEDGQPAPLRDDTDQNVDNGNGNALRAALIRGLGGSFVILGIDGLVTECAKGPSKAFELGLRLNARQPSWRIRPMIFALSSLTKPVSSRTTRRSRSLRSPALRRSASDHTDVSTRTLTTAWNAALAYSHTADRSRWNRIARG
jgi:hypothetical protein